MRFKHSYNKHFFSATCLFIFSLTFAFAENPIVKDVLGKPLLDVDLTPTKEYDPGLLVDDNGAAYIVFGHYRKTDPEQGLNRAIELKDEMTSLVANLNLEILEGNKVIEIKNRGINKGRAALKVLQSHPADKIIAIGDDWTDEFLFSDLPNEATTIKVGMAHTLAGYKVENFEEVRDLLQKLSCNK